MEFTFESLCVHLLSLFFFQGAHHTKMGMSLYRRFSAFKDSVDEFDAHYHRHSGISLLRDYGFCQSEPMSEEIMSRVDVQMPCIIAIHVGLIG